MAKYRKRPVIVEATQWFKMGDHPAVERWSKCLLRCDTCGNKYAAHGHMKTLEGEYIVCPGDYIITGVQGEHYPCKPYIFRETYEEVEDV